MNKHTPGPWTIDERTKHTRVVNVYGADGSVVGYWPYSNARERHNTHLAIKAPEMVDLLRRTYGELNEIHARDGVPYTSQGFPSSVTQECFTSVVEDARALLADIDGET